LLVELKEQFQSEAEEVVSPAEPPPVPANGQSGEAAPVPLNTSMSGPTPMQAEEGVRAMQEAFQNARIPPHWPMYLRNVKQFIKNALPNFDEHRYGFHSFLEAVRSGQRAGLFRLERNRQGILRVYPGNQFSQMQRPMGGGRSEETPTPTEIYDVENDPTLRQHIQGIAVPPVEAAPEEPPVVQVETEESVVVEAAAPEVEEKPRA